MRSFQKRLEKIDFHFVKTEELFEIIEDIAPKMHDNSVFTQNGISLMRSVINVLVYRRDYFNEPFDMVSLSDYLKANSIDKMMMMQDLPEPIKNDLEKVLNLLGYDDHRYREEFEKQLSFATMIFQ